MTNLGASNYKRSMTAASSDIVLHTEKLTKRFGEISAVDNLDLAIREGEVFGFLGPNGAGKSTSINMICGLLQADSGDIFLNGQQIDPYDVLWRERIGVCPQEIIIWPKLTCLEQLEFTGTMHNMARDLARERGNNLLDDLGLHEKRHKLAGTLSGGMQRRLNIALALVHDPQIIILDEPEAGLDPQSRVMVREYIRGLARRKTVIFTTHNMDEAERICDRVAIIDHGRLLRLDSPENLKRSIPGGTVLEVQLNADANPDLVKDGIKKMGLQVLMVNHTMMISGAGLPSSLPAIIEKIKQAGLELKEMRLRENSLEDVFIELTGRRLRE